MRLLKQRLGSGNTSGPSATMVGDSPWPYVGMNEVTYQIRSFIDHIGRDAMRKCVAQLVTTWVCLAVLAGGLLADEPLKVGETAAEHLGTGIDDKPLVLSKYRGNYVCFACVDHHK